MSHQVQWRLKEGMLPGVGGVCRVNRPKLGIVANAYYYPLLVERAKEYRKANGLPIGLGFEQELVNAIYLDCPPDQRDVCFEHDDPWGPIKPIAIGMGDIVLGTKVLTSFVSAGMPVVSQEEAERRAGICSNCRMNVGFKTPCSGVCGEVLDLIKKHVPRSTSKDGQLKGCFICKCVLQVAVWLPLDIQTKPLSEHHRIQFAQMAKESGCWKQAV